MVMNVNERGYIMEFVELLSYTRQYKEEMKNDKDYDLRDFLELIQDFDTDDCNTFEYLREDMNIQDSAEICNNGNYRYYNDIYDLVTEELELSNINQNDIPSWLNIDYRSTFDDLSCYNNYVVCGSDVMYSKILNYWY